MIAFLWPLLRASKARLVLMLLAVLATAAASLLYPVLLKWMIDGVRAERGALHGGSVPLLAALACAYALSAAAGWYANVAAAELGFGLRNELRARFFETLLARPLVSHRTQQTGELSARAVDDIGRLQPLLSGLAVPALQNTLVVAGCLVLMFLLHPAMTFIAIGLMLLPVPFLFTSGKAVLRDFSDSTSAHARANALFEESLVGIREVQSFGREAEQLVRYRRLHDEALKGETHAARRQAGVQQSVSLLLSVLLLGVFFIATTRRVFPSWPVGDAVAFYLYAYAMAMASVSLGRLYLTAQGMTGALRRTMLLFRSTPTRNVNGVGTHRAEIAGAVAFREVSFSYQPGQPVLDALSFSIEAGEWLVVEGASGCGKSTIAALLAGLCEAQRGELRIDGLPMREWDVAHLRRHIALVGQEPMLFHGSLLDNLLFAPGSAAPGSLQRILRASCVDQFLDELPQGLDTPVGERGYTLSGGQKARVAIARALLADPAILILDEANTMLEANLETLLWQRLREERGEKTTIILGHHTSRVPGPCTRLRLDAVRNDAAGS
jgi:ABC-type multidrug transport system fused ATPase/permease subunit